MDNKRRERLREVLSLLDSAADTVNAVCDKEQDCVDNYPENLQGTELFEKMENAVDSLSDAIESIFEAKESIESAIGG